MSTKTPVQDGTELFHNYIKKYKDQVKTESTEGYYPVDVVADAYNQGFSDGTALAKKDFVNKVVKSRIEKFSQRAHQVYILSQNVISTIRELGYSVNSLHIKLSSKCPRVIVSVPDELLLNDAFIHKAYKKVFENKSIFAKLFPETFDISLVSSLDLDYDLLKEDGFGYSEVYTD